jgi:pectin methylesterase-like acyl-CoA thioesterase
MVNGLQPQHLVVSLEYTLFLTLPFLHTLPTSLSPSMSFRTALRTASRPLARSVAAPTQAVARRAASTSSHGTSSNVPWAIGSAAVFGSMVSTAGSSERYHEGC